MDAYSMDLRLRVRADVDNEMRTSAVARSIRSPRVGFASSNDSAVRRAASPRERNACRTPPNSTATCLAWRNSLRSSPCDTPGAALGTWRSGWAGHGVAGVKTPADHLQKK